MADMAPTVPSVSSKIYKNIYVGVFIDYYTIFSHIEYISAILL
jgi:hypothetical protein